MTTSLLDMRIGVQAFGAPAAPATAALEAFMSQQYSRPSLAADDDEEEQQQQRPLSTPSSPAGVGARKPGALKRVRSAVISPCNSGVDLGRDGSACSGGAPTVTAASDALDLSALVRAAAPVEDSVAFPSIEWNADDEDDDDENDDLTGFACGFFSRSLDQQLSHRSLSHDDEDSDDDEEEDVSCRAPPRKRRSNSSLHTLADRSKTRSNSLEEMPPPRMKMREGAATAALRRQSQSSTALVSPGSSFGGNSAASTSTLTTISSSSSGPASSSLLTGLLGQLGTPPLALPSSLSSPPPLDKWGQFAVTLRPSSPSISSAGMRRSRSSRDIPKRRSSGPVGHQTVRM